MKLSLAGAVDQFVKGKVCHGIKQNFVLQLLLI